MELNEEKLACPVRGKSLPLKIAKDADCKTLLESALKKRMNYMTKHLTPNAHTNSCIRMDSQLRIKSERSQELSMSNPQQSDFMLEAQVGFGTFWIFFKKFNK